MRRSSPKEVFVIHTKSIPIDRSIVDSLAKLLLPNGFTMWGYSDWSWKVKRADEPTWEDALSSHGFLDPEQELEALNGPQPRFPPPVDRGMIDYILLKTRAIIFLNPTRHKLSAGMREELLSLRRLQRMLAYGAQSKEMIVIHTPWTHLAMVILHGRVKY